MLGAIGGAFGVLFLAGSIPISSLADRFPRTRVAAISIAVWSAMVALTGAVQNALPAVPGPARAAGSAARTSCPVAQPLLVDTYPIEARGRVFALDGALRHRGPALAPLAAGGIAALFAGDESWRWVFLLTGDRRRPGRRC